MKPAILALLLISAAYADASSDAATAEEAA